MSPIIDAVRKIGIIAKQKKWDTLADYYSFRYEHSFKQSMSEEDFKRLIVDMVVIVKMDYIGLPRFIS